MTIQIKSLESVTETEPLQEIGDDIFFGEFPMADLGPKFEPATLTADKFLLSHGSSLFGRSHHVRLVDPFVLDRPSRANTACDLYIGFRAPHPGSLSDPAISWTPVSRETFDPTSDKYLAESDFNQAATDASETIRRWASVQEMEVSEEATEHYELLAYELSSFFKHYGKSAWNALLSALQSEKLAPDIFAPFLQAAFDNARKSDNGGREFFTKLLNAGEPSWRYLSAAILNRDEVWAKQVLMDRGKIEQNASVLAAIRASLR